MAQYHELDRQALVIDYIKNTIRHGGNEGLVADVVGQENDPGFLTRLRDNVSDHALYDDYLDIINSRIQYLASDTSMDSLDVDSTYSPSNDWSDTNSDADTFSLDSWSSMDSLGEGYGEEGVDGWREDLSEAYFETEVPLRHAESTESIDSAFSDSRDDSMATIDQQAPAQLYRASSVDSGIGDEIELTDKELSSDIFRHLDTLTERDIVPNQETLPITEERKLKFRYAADKKISQIPSNTAIELPTMAGDSPKRFHGNYVQLHPKEPLTIATQSPKAAAQADFWLANFLNEARAIVDLTQPMDMAKGKAAIYYPEGQETLTFKSGGETLKVSLRSQVDHPENSEIQCSEYQVVDSHGNEKVISRVHFKGWVDHHGVEAGVLNQLIDTVDDIAGRDGVITVHCSAGVGRTGTFITARTAKHQLAGRTLHSAQIRDEILHMGAEGRMQRNRAFIQKDEQMLTLVQFLKSLDAFDQTGPSPTTASGEQGITSEVKARPPIAPKPLTLERFWENYDQHLASESKDVWGRIVNDLKRVPLGNHDEILNEFESLQSGTRAYLQGLLKGK